MGQTLTNGIYLPNEGERNCYSGLAANWNAVDTLKGNYSLHAINVDIHVTAAEKETWNGKADNSALTAHTGDTTIHVTSADKQAWDGKADASALTAHTGNTTIHVTAENKQAWDGKADASALTAHTGDTTIHVTAADKQAWNGHVADTTIHVTSADKQAWNGKADASALTAHTGDTTIHVTAADKQAWNGHVADSVKHVTAEDKAKWDAVTSKADDSDVVHKSRNETVTGTKTIKGVNLNFESGIGEYGVTGGGASLNFYDKNSLLLSYIKQGMYSSGISYHKFSISAYDSDNNQIERTITLSGSSNSLSNIYLRSDLDNIAYLGTSGNRWARVYATNYYYGSDNVEFSTKFVTTDTNQTIGGIKSFSNDIIRGYTTITSRAIKGFGYFDTTGLNGSGYIQLQANLIYNDSTPSRQVTVTLEILENAYADGRKSSFSPNSNNTTNLGKSGKRWGSVYATNYYYGSSEIEFSQKFVTTDTNQTISGNKTFSSINGVEPSALSLPSGNANKVIDISSYITNLDGTANSYTVPANGWISIAVVGTAIAIVSSSWSDSRLRASSGDVRMLYPVLKNETLNILITGTTLAYARFIPCQGNV